jgi:hypothetical protein
MSNHNVTPRQLRQELRDAGWSHLETRGSSETWRFGSHRVEFQDRGGEVGPKVVAIVRKAIAIANQEPVVALARVRPGLPAAPTPKPDEPATAQEGPGPGPGSTAARPAPHEVELIGPAVPEVGQKFRVQAEFRPALSLGLLVEVECLRRMARLGLVSESTGPDGLLLYALATVKTKPRSETALPASPAVPAQTAPPTAVVSEDLAEARRLLGRATLSLREVVDALSPLVRGEQPGDLARAAADELVSLAQQLGAERARHAAAQQLGAERARHAARHAATTPRVAPGAPPAPTPLGDVPGWTVERLQALAARTDPAGIVRAALGREPTREELLAAALAALERQLGTS